MYIYIYAYIFGGRLQQRGPAASGAADRGLESNVI